MITVNKRYDWDALVYECCQHTPITHKVWKTLILKNKLRLQRNNINNLENLLYKWIEKGHKYRTYGPYPANWEQELYIQDTIPPQLSDLINTAIVR